MGKYSQKNRSMTLCDMQIRHQSHVLRGYMTFFSMHGSCAMAGRPLYVQPSSISGEEVSLRTLLGERCYLGLEGGGHLAQGLGISLLGGGGGFWAGLCGYTTFGMESNWVPK